MSSRSNTTTSSSKPKKLGTVAVRGGQKRKDALDAVTTPIACTATYAFGSSSELADHFEGKIERDEYGRYGNPTVRAAERKLTALEDGEDTVLFASGMAAITTTLLSLLKAGDHVILAGECYRRTRSFVTETLGRFGVSHTVVPNGNADTIAQEVHAKTKVILTEAPTNPYLRVVDLEAIASTKGRAKLIIDATFATPVNGRPLAHGADLVIHSCTKYLGGHNDLLAGSVTGNSALISLVRQSRDVLGAVLDPHAAYLLLRGIKTLHLRVERQNQTAQKVAEWLEAQPNVERVFYPGLSSHPDHRTAKKYFTGFGGVVTFVLRADYATTSAALDACELATIAPSLGGVETLIEQPALMSFYGLEKAEREALGIQDGLVRLSVGLEEVEDIVDDLARALAVVENARSPKTPLAKKSSTEARHVAIA